MNTDALQQWQTAVNDWLMWINSGAVSRHTLQLRRYQLTRAASALPCGPWEITPEHLQAWLADQNWRPETRRSYLAALRSFFGWAHAHGSIAADPSRLLRRVKSTKGRPRPASERIVNGALDRADDRARLMIMLGSRHGLRRGEICQVHTSDVVEDLDGWSLVVHGKGGKDRTVPLLDDVARVLRALPAGWAFPNGT
jgi:integrase/recombinase XerC